MPPASNVLDIGANIEAMAAALHAARVVAWEWDPLADRVVHTRNAHEVLGLPEGRAFTRAEDFFSLIHLEDVAGARSLLEGTVANREPHIAVVRIIRPDNGEVRWIENHANVLVTAEQQLTKLAGIAFDVTEREVAKAEKEQLEKQIESNRQNLEAIIEILPIGIAIAHDPDCRRITLNPSLRQLFGVDRGTNVSHTRDDGEPSTYEVFKDGRLLKPEEMPLQRAARGSQVVKEQLELRFADGRRCHFVGSATPLLGADGRPNGAVGAFLDVSDWMESRRQREELLEVEQRMRREVESANLAKDRFIATLSHELRTPLTPVLLTTAELETHPALPEELREPIAMIHRCVGLEARLIDDLLDLTRVTHGKLHLHLQPCDAHLLISRALHIVRADTLGRVLEWHIDLDAEEHWICADPARFKQVVWNLVKNAVKFTPDGGCIMLRTHNDGHDFVFEVEDTGIGIEATLLPRIFNAFEQGEYPEQHRLGGLGLGLAISKAVTELHGGRINAESAGRGKGSRFSMRMSTSPNTATVDGSETPLAVGSRRLRILVVEDHEATRRVLADLLRRRGHLVDVAEGVTDALELAERYPHDVLISDLGLPDGNGCEIMQFVRKLGIPGIALTGYGMEEDLKRSLEAGFRSHLTKPIDFALLERELTQIGADLV